MDARHILPRIGLDIACWFGAPSIFLYAYVTHYFAPRDSISPHIYLISLIFVALITLRLSFNLVMADQAKARLAASLLTSFLVASIIIYYCLVLIGLESWGRVISWQLIASYFGQLPELLDTLGISFFLAVVALTLAYSALLTATWIYFYQFDWIPQFALTTTIRFRAVILSLGFLICAAGFFGFATSPRVGEGEPISLTLFPWVASYLPGSSIDKQGAARLDRLDEEARSVYRPNPHADRKNVVVIVVDALRPDHMGLLGYRRDTTPSLSKLSGRCQATVLHATCGDSSCGLRSLAASKFVYQFSMHPFTLQEALKKHGYAIHMILSGDHTNFYNLKEAYGAVDSYFDGSNHTRKYYINDDQLVLDHLETFPPWNGQPVMIQFHLMSAHTLAKHEQATARFLPAESYTVPTNRTQYPDGSPDQRSINYYDNGVLKADAVIENILRKLEKKGYLDNTMVVITADHGEALGEHGLYTHANSVQEELLRIPFVLIPFGYHITTDIRWKATNSQVDIAPTILAELGMPLPKTWSGLPMQNPEIRNSSYFQQGLDIGLISYEDEKFLWKYWINSKTREEKSFNLSVDPGEHHNLVDTVAPDLKRKWRLGVLPSAASAALIEH